MNIVERGRDSVQWLHELAGRKAWEWRQHGGSSLLRVAEWLRPEMGRQERWLLWRPLEEEPGEGESPSRMAGVPPGRVSYLDTLGI